MSRNSAQGQKYKIHWRWRGPMRDHLGPVKKGPSKPKRSRPEPPTEDLPSSPGFTIADFLDKDKT